MPFEYGLFTQDDFLQIDNVLYTPKIEELPHRKIFGLNTSFARYAKEIGYDYYKRTGYWHPVAAQKTFRLSANPADALPRKPTR
jgi:hypothetical protein